jgi:vitamin B12 transporter
MRHGRIRLRFLIPMLAVFPLAFSPVAVRGDQAGSSPASSMAGASKPSPPASKKLSAKKVTRVPPVVVTASKITEPLSQVAVSVTVITQEDIRRRQAQSVEELLRDVPGVDVLSSGGSPGTFTEVRVRGANTSQVAILVNGARVNDLFTGGGFDFGLFPIDNIDRIEVIRGGASALYGSDATGGVINIITKKGKGKPSLTVFSEGGSQRTFREGAAYAGKVGGTDFAFSYSRLDSAGLRPGPFNHNHDRENHYSVLVGHDFGDEDHPRARIQSSFNANTQDFQVPFDFPFNFDFAAVPPFVPLGFETYEPNDVQRRIFFTTTNEVLLKVTDWWETRLRFSLTQNRLRADNDLDRGVPFPFLFHFPFVTNLNHTCTADTIAEAEWLNHFTFEGAHWRNVFTAGYQFERDHTAFRDFSTSGSFGFPPPLFSTVSATRNRNAHYYQDQLVLWDRLYLNAGFRADQETEEAHILSPGAVVKTHLQTDSLFGIEYDPRFSAALDLHEIGVKLHGAWSRDFHAPTFSSLFFPGISNPDLKPEIAKNIEGGVTFTYLDGKLGGDVTYFRADYTDLIVFVLAPPPKFFDLRNHAKAKAEGLEISAYAGSWKGIRVSGNYTLLDTRGDDGKPLPRRPRHKFNATLSYARGRFTGNLDLNYVGRQRDPFDFVGADGEIRRGDLRAYHRVDLAATFDLLRGRGPLKKLEVYTRMNNLFDTHFEEVKGYPAAGTTVVGGIRGTF